VDNTFSLSGSIFLDYRNARDFSDSYSIIYGHHMEGNVMFGELPNFLEADYFESHASGVLFTPADTYQIEWIACVETDAYDSRFYTPIGTADSEQISELLSNILSAATQFRNVEVSTNDRLVALSTCSNLSTDGRVILIGRLSQQDL
jgi:sortase B